MHLLCFVLARTTNVLVEQNTHDKIITTKGKWNGGEDAGGSVHKSIPFSILQVRGVQNGGCLASSWEASLIDANRAFGRVKHRHFGYIANVA
jgi:hypothetical protein